MRLRCSCSAGSLVTPTVTTMTAAKATAMMPKLLTKASVVSSNCNPVVVGKSTNEIKAMGTVTTSVEETRPQASLSWMAATITSRMEISDVMPAKTRAPKNNTPSTEPKGACETIVGNATKASPMPPLTTSSIATLWACAMKPSTAKTPMPASSSKPELAKATTEPDPVRSVLRLRVGGIGDHDAEGDGKGEEDLPVGCGPDSGVRQGAPIRGEEGVQSFHGPGRNNACTTRMTNMTTSSGRKMLLAFEMPRRTPRTMMAMITAQTMNSGINTPGT